MRSRVLGTVPPIQRAWRALKGWTRTDPLPTAIYRKTFDRGRLTLPLISPEEIGPSSRTIELPTIYPLLAGEDAPLADLLFLLNAAKGRKARRILEVGTYRARTTYALHINCPDAVIVSYDVQVLDSEYRRLLADAPQVELRVQSFSKAAETLRSEPPFDLIFIDGSHRVEDVVADSRLALQITAAGGLIVWHDYRPNDYSTRELRVPEGLEQVRSEVEVFAVMGTTCAIHQKPHGTGV